MHCDISGTVIANVKPTLPETNCGNVFKYNTSITKQGEELWDAKDGYYKRVVLQFLGAVHGPRAILSDMKTNSLLCLSGGIFFDRTSVVALKKVLPCLWQTGPPADGQAAWQERCCPRERSEAISPHTAGDCFGKERLAMTNRGRLLGELLPTKLELVNQKLSYSL